MKVLWLSHLIPYPPKGGVLQRAYHLLHEISKYHHVDLLAFHQSNLMRPLFDSLDEGVAESKRVLSSFCGNVEFVDINSEQQKFWQHRLALKSLVSRDPYTINWLKSSAYARALKKLLQENEYDLVHLDSINAPFHIGGNSSLDQDITPTILIQVQLQPIFHSTFSRQIFSQVDDHIDPGCGDFHIDPDDVYAPQIIHLIGTEGPLQDICRVVITVSYSLRSVVN